MPVFLLLPVLLAANDKQDSDNEQLRKSTLTEPTNFNPDKSRERGHNREDYGCEVK